MGFFNKSKEDGRSAASSLFSSSGKDHFKVKKLQIIKPYLNPVDSDHLYNMVLRRFKNSPEGKDPKNVEKFESIIRKHFMDDIFNLYYTDSENAEFDVRNATNDFRYKMLEKINKAGIKIISNRSAFNSSIFSNEIANYFYTLYKDLSSEELKKLQKMMDGEGSGDGEGKGPQGKGKSSGEGEDENDQDSQPGEGNGYGKRPGKGDSNQKSPDILENLLNSSQSDQLLEQAMKKAEDQLKTVEESGIEVNENNAKEMVGKMDDLMRSRYEIAQLNISKEGILKAVKAIMNKSTTYFSHNYKVKEVDLFEAEDLLGMEGIEFLHPLFKNGMLENVITREKIYLGKYDLYVDNSGSMSSSACLPGHPQVTNMLLGKAIALRMKRMDLLRDLYEFQSTVTKLENNEFGILSMGARGGTSLDAVVRSIIKQNENSVVLTDGEDPVSLYTDKAVFIGVGGVNFNYFKQSAVGKQYIERGQCIIFDGVNLSYPKI